MKHHNFINYLILISFFFVASCNSDNENNLSDNEIKSLKVRHIDPICCGGDLMTIDNQLISDNCGTTYRDSLLWPINKDDFEIFQTLQINDKVIIDFELTEPCVAGKRAADCDFICNRHEGVPIKIISVAIE